jgi:O-antigen biosynthesis protein
MSEKKVVIVVATCNQEELFKKCIKSIQTNTDYPNYKIYAIDDSGKDYLSSKTKEDLMGVVLEVNKKNEGLPYTFNLGMKYGFETENADYVALLNDDLEFTDKLWLRKLIAVMESDDRIGAVHPKMIYPEGYLQYFHKDGKMNFIRTREKAKKIEDSSDTFKIVPVEELPGTCILFKRRVYKEIGGWDMGFSPIYGEDTDWSLRANKKGFKQMYVGTTNVIHYNGSSEKILEFSEGKWHLQKSHGIRLEWLNFSVGKIIKLTVIHFGSAIFSKHIFKNLKLLFRAYKDNFNNLKEIRSKRRERNTWTRLY